MKKNKKKISEEIQNFIKEVKEPDLALYISYPETLTIKIRFIKKNGSDLPKLKIEYFNTTSKKKNEDFLMYDYIGHLQKFGFEWNHVSLGFRYRIEINNNKLKKYIFLSKTSRKKFHTDESRVWNMDNQWKDDDDDKIF